MNKELFRSMRGQMQPSEAARAALTEKLAKKKTVPIGRYAAIAACAVVLLAAVPVYGMVRNHLRWREILDNFQTSDSRVEVTKPHSYVLSSDAACWPEDTSAPERNSIATGETLDELPGGAYMGDIPAQGEAVMAYQNLMSRFEADYGRCPEWYGGAYIDAHANLIVNIVAAYDERMEDKELYFQIKEWAGSDRIGFGNTELSLNQLRELQNKVAAAMEELGLPMGCGVNEETGQVELTLPEVTEEALWRLAELDPEDTAILAIVGKAPSVDDLAEEAAPSVTQSVRPGGDA